MATLLPAFSRSAARGTAASSGDTVGQSTPNDDGTILKACCGGVYAISCTSLGHRDHALAGAGDVLEQAGQCALLLVRAAHRRLGGLADDGHDRHVVALG